VQLRQLCVDQYAHLRRRRTLGPKLAASIASSDHEPILAVVRGLKLKIPLLRIDPGGKSPVGPVVLRDVELYFGRERGTSRQAVNRKRNAERILPTGNQR